MHAVLATAPVTICPMAPRPWRSMSRSWSFMICNGQNDAVKKVNQAMAMGVPVVATNIAVEGMHTVSGEDVLVAADLDEFVDQLERVYHDASLWLRLSRNGRNNIRTFFSPEVARRQLREVVAPLLV